MIRAFVLSLLAISLCVPSLALAETPYRIGALTLGMSFEEARAALPDAQWITVEQSPRTGKPLAIGARGNATNFGGLPIAVAVRPGWYGGQTIMGIHADQALDPVACEKRMTDFATIVSDRFGELKGFMPTRPESYQAYITTYSVGRNGEVRPSGGRMQTMTRYVPLGTWVKLGERGKIARTNSGGGGFNLDGRREAGDVRILFAGGWTPGDGCIGSIELKRVPKVPEPMVLDRSGAPLDLAQFSLGNRHHVLDFAPAGFSKSRQFFVRCKLAVPGGRVGRCEAEKLRGTDRWFLTRAGQIAEVSVPAMPDLVADADPDDPRLRQVRVLVTLDPAWRQSVDFAAAQLTPASEFAALPAGGLRRPFPDYAESRVSGEARVTVRCRVERDFSTICTEVKVEAADLQDLMGTYAIRVAREVKIDQRLRSGATSAGTFFETVVTFSHGGVAVETPAATESPPEPATPESK